MNIKEIKVYGERNSGTNYLISLLEANLKGKNVKIVQKKYGWKHRFVDANELKATDTSETLFIFISKDLYSWTISMNNKPHHAPQLYGLDFDTFLHSEWACYEGKGYATRDLKKNPIKPEEEMMFERNPNTGERFKNVILLRNEKNKRYLKLKEACEHHHFIKYYDLLYTPKRTLRMMAREFDLNLQAEIQLNDGYHGKNPKQKFNRKRFYLQQEYFNSYTQQQLDYVNQFFDEETESALGYEIIKKLPEKTGISSTQIKST